MKSMYPKKVIENMRIMAMLRTMFILGVNKGRLEPNVPAERLYKEWLIEQANKGETNK